MSSPSAEEGIPQAEEVAVAGQPQGADCMAEAALAFSHPGCVVGRAGASGVGPSRPRRSRRRREGARARCPRVEKSISMAWLPPASGAHQRVHAPPPGTRPTVVPPPGTAGRSRSDPRWTPNTSARATARAALEDRPGTHRQGGFDVQGAARFGAGQGHHGSDQTGPRVVRWHGDGVLPGSRDPSGRERSGPGSNAAEVTDDRRHRSDGSKYSTVTPSPMAMGRARPRL